MSFKLNKEAAIKFAVYLYDNRYLDDECEITKKNARLAFKQFRKSLSFNTNYYDVFWATVKSKILASSKNVNILIYKEAKILRFKQDVGSGTVNNGSSETKTKTRMFVTQAVAFNRPRQKEEIVSNKTCLLCAVAFTDQANYELHLKDKAHEFRQFFNKTLQGPKCKLRVHVEGFNSPKNIILRLNESSNINLIIENPLNVAVKILRIKRLSNEIILDINEFIIKPKSKSCIAILRVCFKTDGFVYFPVLVELSDDNNSLLRLPVELVFHVHSPIYDDLQACEPYRKPTAAYKFAFTDIVKGERPKPIAVEYEVKIPLKRYQMDQTLVTLLNSGLKSFAGITEAQTGRLESIKKSLDVPDKRNCLTVANYTEMLDLLLFIEEHQMQKDIHDYDCSNQKLAPVKNSNFLELQVPGLAEHRPSLVRGDSVFVKADKESLVVYEGIVHKILESSVWLAFADKFRKQIYVNNMSFHVSFSYNRFTLKVEHQALELCKKHKLNPLFFPVECPEVDLQFHFDLNRLDEKVRNNAQQRQAVQCILKKTAMPYPYLIFGPPGTGKTKTIVEAIQQIYLTNPENILVCAPSNNAANEIARRLGNIPKSDMMRLVAASYNYNELPEEIRPYTNYKNGEVYYPPLSKLIKYKIIVTTLITASRLANAAVPANHFGYVFIDESGHATESETLIAISGIVSSAKCPGNIYSQIVLAGDPKQLGPVVHSKLAAGYGFDTSMLERLMNNVKVYCKNEENKYNPAYLTKLLKNYRSHPAIIKPSNDMFYEGEIEASGDDLVDLFLGWEELKNEMFPVIFHSVAGIDQREKDSPSFFNVQEVDIVTKYLEKLLGNRFNGKKITEKDIGIIAPYRKQVQKLKKICAKKNYKDIFVGSVEQIQGQERLVIIISTVRSKPDFLKFDNKFNLGFLKNYKRLNVAISRAKALLIIVGNPSTLQYDEHWEKLISYCKDKGSFVGNKVVLDKDELLCNELESLSIREYDFNTVEDGANFSRGNL